MDDMHPAIQLAVARLESNPDDGEKIHRMTEPYRQYMGSAEKAVLVEALRQAMLAKLHKSLMQYLLTKEKSDGA
jgi:hypothetical protein